MNDNTPNREKLRALNVLLDYAGVEIEEVCPEAARYVKLAQEALQDELILAGRDARVADLPRYPRRFHHA